MSNPRPRITVITVTLNGVAVIEATLLSVLSQDYPDLEYVVVRLRSKISKCRVDVGQDKFMHVDRWPSSPAA